MHLDEENKSLLKAQLLEGEIYCNADDWEAYCWSFGVGFLQQFIDYETVQGTRTRLKPSRNLRRFYEDDSDLFEAIDNQSINQ